MKILTTSTEQTVLRKLMREYRPQRVLEIGTGYGSSAVLIDKVLPVKSILVTLDDAPKDRDFLDSTTKVKLLEKKSPQAIAEASEIAGGLFDFVFIDGDHTYESVSSDIRGVLDYTTPDAYLLFHDAFNENVKRAIDEVAGDFEDYGLLTKDVSEADGQQWGGLRLLQKK